MDDFDYTPRRLALQVFNGLLTKLSTSHQFDPQPIQFCKGSPLGKARTHSFLLGSIPSPFLW